MTFLWMNLRLCWNFLMIHFFRNSLTLENGQEGKLVEVHEVIIKISIKGFCTHETIHRHHVGFHITNGQKFHHCPNDPSWSSMAMTTKPIMVPTLDNHHGQDLNDHHSVTPDYWYLFVLTGWRPGEAGSPNGTTYRDQHNEQLWGYFHLYAEFDYFLLQNQFVASISRTCLWSW